MVVWTKKNSQMLAICYVFCENLHLQMLPPIFFVCIHSVPPLKISNGIALKWHSHSKPMQYSIRNQRFPLV